MPFKRLFGGRRRGTSSSRGNEDDSSDQWPPFQPIHDTDPSASLNFDQQSPAPGPAPGSWQSQVPSQTWNQGMQFEMYNPYARQLQHNQAHDADTYHPGGSLDVGLRPTVYESQSYDGSSSAQGGTGYSEDTPAYSPNTVAPATRYNAFTQAMLNQANANLHRCSYTAANMTQEPLGEVSWKHVQDTFREYLKAREVVPREIRPSWFREIIPSLEQEGINYTTVEHNPDRVDDAIDQSVFAPYYRAACDRDARVEIRRVNSDTAWASLQFGCVKPDLDVEVMKGVLAFSSQITRDDIVSKNWRWARSAALTEAQLSVRDEYRAARRLRVGKSARDRVRAEYQRREENRQDELSVPFADQDGLIRRFREANGCWSEDDDVTAPVPGERIQDPRDSWEALH
ncbi:hypothetical protein I204_07634 [Kwoniella mangroviensis CBS 8886]|nr:hypothetical protein I204_07634 [Kwoniella mangroviensis CBS 8886]